MAVEPRPIFVMDCLLLRWTHSPFLLPSSTGDSGWEISLISWGHESPLEAETSSQLTSSGTGNVLVRIFPMLDLSGLSFGLTLREIRKC